MALPSGERAPRYGAGDVIAGKYRLDGLLGEGGMGAVWAAFNLQLEAPVAIKLLVRNDGDQSVLTQRLKQEAKATAKLGHPAIVRVFDVGETELGDAFIVMELLQGRSLATLLAEEVCLSGQQAVRLLLPIADALSVAHAKGIVHRDLKPDNVFIVTDDDRLQPKLVDFGIVKLTDVPASRTHLTQMGTVLGSPDYMSPEQARGLDDIDHRSDVWSFAVVLYELVTGVTPFAAANYNALLRSIVEDEPRAFTARSPEEAELWLLVQRGLAKDREQRFRTMSEFGRALAAWLIRQGVPDDVCGVSLETKWILRASDPSGLGPARGSLPSIGSLAPASGVRPSGELANAVTVQAPSTGSGHSRAVVESKPEVVRVTEPSARSVRVWVVAAATAVLVATAAFAFGGKRSESTSANTTPAPQAVAPPEVMRTTPAVEAKIPGAPEPPATAALEATPPAAAAPPPAPSALGAAPAIRRTSRAARPPRATPANTTESTKNDLISPY